MGTDRRKEGDLFTPPSARHAYVKKLRALVKDEQCVRSKRKETFFSQDFKMNEPGSLFPHSWKPSFEIEELQDWKRCGDAAMLTIPRKRDGRVGLRGEDHSS